jgi:hypothetical protein
MVSAITLPFGYCLSLAEEHLTVLDHLLRELLGGDGVTLEGLKPVRLEIGWIEVDRASAAALREQVQYESSGWPCAHGNHGLKPVRRPTGRDRRARVGRDLLAGLGATSQIGSAPPDSRNGSSTNLSSGVLQSRNAITTSPVLDSDTPSDKLGGNSSSEQLEIANTTAVMARAPASVRRRLGLNLLIRSRRPRTWDLNTQTPTAISTGQISV